MKAARQWLSGSLDISRCSLALKRDVEAAAAAAADTDTAPPSAVGPGGGRVEGRAGPGVKLVADRDGASIAGVAGAEVGSPRVSHYDHLIVGY